jgi:hypothetical protein
MAPIHIPDTCATREQLGESVRQSQLEMIRLGEKEVQAILGGDLTALSEIENQLRDARRKHDTNLAALGDHIAEHDCI